MTENFKGKLLRKPFLALPPFKLSLERQRILRWAEESLDTQRKDFEHCPTPFLWLLHIPKCCRSERVRKMYNPPSSLGTHGWSETVSSFSCTTMASGSWCLGHACFDDGLIVWQPWRELPKQRNLFGIWWPKGVSEMVMKKYGSRK